VNLILLGPPGVGKGSHAKMFTREMNIPQVSTGDMLREHMRQGTDLGLAARRFIDAGELVPDEVVIGMVRLRLAEPDAQNGYILDGFPRTVPQAEALEAFTQVDYVVKLLAREDIIMEHLAGRRVCGACGSTFHTRTLGSSMTCPECGGQLVHRKDDQPETIKNRLEVYARQTAPLIGYYRAKGNLLDVRVEGLLESDHQVIRKALGLA
jgi:adenylate kinase